MKMKIYFFLLGISTLIAISQGLSLIRHERVAEKFPIFVKLTASDKNSTIKKTETLRTVQPNNYDENLKTLPRIIEEFIIPIDHDDEDNDNSFKTINSEVAPKNIILLFIQEFGANGQKIWNDLRKSHIFPIEGHLQSCQDEKNFVEFPLEESMNADDYSKCDCRDFLQRNVRNLLNWAHRLKISMSSFETKQKLQTLIETYGIFPSANPNNTIPPLLRRETSILFRELFGEHSELEKNWHLLDLNILKFFPYDKLPAEEEFYDFFENFSMTRIAFFQKWLNSLYHSDEKSEDLNGNLLELVIDTIAKTKSLPYDQNFIFIAFSPGNQLSAAVDFLKNTVSDLDTLLLVSGTCSEEGRGIPFFAHGPGSKYFYQANSIWDLPVLMKRISTDCEGLWCKIESLNKKLNFKKKHSKRTVKNEIPIAVMENSTSINNANEVMIKNTTTSVTDVTMEVTNATAGNVSTTTTQSTVPPLKKLEPNNSTLETKTSNANNTNVTNSNDLKTNSTFNDVTTPVIRKSSFENNITEIGTTTIDSNHTILMTVEDVNKTTEKSTSTKKTEEEIKISGKIDEEQSSLKEIINVSKNITNEGNETETIVAISEASDYSKQTTTVVISVATSFAALLLFQF